MEHKTVSSAKTQARIVATGMTGNTGFEVLKKLLENEPDRRVLALVRADSLIDRLQSMNIEILVCDLNDPTTYSRHIQKGDVFLEMANLRQARVMVPVLAKLGISRAFCVTTTGVFSVHHSYSALYREIEQEMRGLPMDLTILRPSMIYGNERDHNMHKLLKIISRFPVYPIFGNGRALMQPVHVEDLAEGIVTAVIRDVRGEFNLAGPAALPYREIVAQAFVAAGRRGFLLFIPVAPVAFLAGLLQKIPGFPIKKEQVIRLQENKSFDISNAQRELDYAPRPFATGIAQEVERLRKAGQL